MAESVQRPRSVRHPVAHCRCSETTTAVSCTWRASVETTHAICPSRRSRTTMTGNRRSSMHLQRTRACHPRRGRNSSQRWARFLQARPSMQRGWRSRPRRIRRWRAASLREESELGRCVRVVQRVTISSQQPCVISLCRIANVGQWCLCSRSLGSEPPPLNRRVRLPPACVRRALLRASSRRRATPAQSRPSLVSPLQPHNHGRTAARLCHELGPREAERPKGTALQHLGRKGELAL